MLVLEAVESGYGLVPVLRQIGLRLSAGEIVVVLGPNGAGKSTLLRTISGLLPARTGSITLDGIALTGLTAHRIARTGVAHVIEGRGIFPNLSVRENLTLGQFLGGSRSTLSARVEQAIERFPWMADRLDDPGGRLSGGQQQMLAIARALLGQPRLLMLDEPSLGLAPLITSELFEHLRGLATADLAVLIVEQQVQRALEIADRGYVMQRGRFVLEGSASELQTGSGVEDAYMS